MCKCLIYCCRAKPYLVQGLAKPMHTLDANNPYNFNWKVVKKGFSSDRLNGKIVCECDIETEELTQLGCGEPMLFTTKTLDSLEVCKRSCLKTEELSDYLYNQDKDSKGYALHITSLNILDKALSLNECEKDFKGKPASHYWIGRLTDNYVDDNWSDLVCVQRAPTNMCWVWYKGERYILISIQSKWLCKILNGAKTIEVRRKVLKGMVE